MTRYKAVESYYDEQGNEIINLCGFGLVEDIAEAKSQFSGRVEIIEITAEELASLWAEHDESWSSSVMGKIGSIKSEKKANASRENGKKGGRPRKLLEPEREEQLGFTGAEGLFSETPRKSPAN